MDLSVALGRKRKKRMFAQQPDCGQGAEDEMMMLMMMYSWGCICLFSLFLVTVTYSLDFLSHFHNSNINSSIGKF